MTDDELAICLKNSGSDRCVTPEGVVFQSENPARIYALNNDKDLVRISGTPPVWLARNRETKSGAIPTKEGDVVVRHKRQLFTVWVTTSNGAQGPDPNVTASDFWKHSEAEDAAIKWATETKGRIFLLQDDGCWSVRSN